jgi:hypothetical protein
VRKPGVGYMCYMVVEEGEHRSLAAARVRRIGLEEGLRIVQGEVRRSLAVAEDIDPAVEADTEERHSLAVGVGIEERHSLVVEEEGIGLAAEVDIGERHSLAGLAEDIDLAAEEDIEGLRKAVVHKEAAGSLLDVSICTRMIRHLQLTSLRGSAIRRLITTLVVCHDIFFLCLLTVSSSCLQSSLRSVNLCRGLMEDKQQVVG